MTCIQTFPPQESLAILSGLTAMGYVSDSSEDGATARGCWQFEDWDHIGSSAQPCFAICPAMRRDDGEDFTGTVCLMAFPDGHYVLHHGYGNKVSYPEGTLEQAVLEAEQLAQGMMQ